MKELRLSGVIRESIVDGPGIRMVVFTQGCPHRCIGCHNPETHDFNGGYISRPENILKAIGENPLLQGVTFSGGEPFCQAEALAELAEAIKEKGLHIMTYTGYTFEEIKNGIAEGKPGWKNLLELTDILVDGKFILEERSLNLLFRGSKNQRLIDIPKTLALEEICLWQGDSEITKYKK